MVAVSPSSLFLTRSYTRGFAKTTEEEKGTARLNGYRQAVLQDFSEVLLLKVVYF